MAATITDRAVALARLQGMLQYASEPALTAGEVSDILDRHVIATTWTADTAYQVGDLVVPATLNGGMWRCEEGGTSDDTVVPDFDVPDEGYTQTVDDGTVAWEYDGPAPPCLWDLRASAYEGWMAKVGKAAGTGSISAGRLRIDGGGVREACLAQARLYAPVGVA